MKTHLGAIMDYMDVNDIAWSDVSRIIDTTASTIIFLSYIIVYVVHIDILSLIQ